MQMALVASGIANAGTVMRPYVVARVTDPLGETLSTTQPRRWTEATDPVTAATVRDMMVVVVEKGSGRRAQVPGVPVAGKTGTAEVGKTRTTNAWFIAFAPADAPTVAMAIMLEEGGVGGRVAAPRSRGVLEAALTAQGSMASADESQVTPQVAEGNR
jgi:peptidoglycan glycosyltransferase